MILRRAYLFLLALMLFAAGGAATAGNTYTFNGNAVGNCTLSGATYTCPSLPLPAADDTMVIASGFTVNIASDVTFDFNQTLTMSGSAVLAATGDLNIGGIATNNLKVTGGTLIAGDTFSVGAQNQTLTANIQAATANLGTGSQLSITGSIKASGTVNVASHATINGAISGATVTTSSPVTLTGNIVATQSFTLASGSTVKGNVTAPVVSLLPSGSTVTGNITAKTSLQLGSGDAVTGDVVAGTLTLDSSEAIVNGNATIDSGVFNWHGRVTQTIYCTGGTTKGQCDCVSNNSGYDVNTANGPHCQGKSVPLDHFLIAYDPTGSVCAPSTAKVTACANASCSNTYGGGVNVTLTGTGQAGSTSQTVAVPTSGSVQTTVTWTQPGTFTLGVSGATSAGATQCIRNSDAAPGADCKVAVASSAYTLTTNGTAFYAEAQGSQTAPVLTLAAVRYDAKANSCVPLFNNTVRNVNFTCAYANPTSGTLPLRLNGKALRADLDATKACDNVGTTLALSFDANGKATLPMQYADAGAVKVTATDNGAGSPGTANATTTFVPAKLQIALANTNAPYVAGKDFVATVTALNGASTPTATPNFGREMTPETIALAPVACLPNNNNGLLTQKSSTLAAGAQTITSYWSETGRIDLTASLASGNYLGVNMQPAPATTSTSTTACTGTVGPFIPAYFTFDADPAWTRKMTINSQPVPLYYSGEPAIQLKVTARNMQNGVTQNYAGAYARDVVFTAINPDGTALATAAAGAFSRSTAYAASESGTAQLRATDFTAGVGTWTGSWTFTKSPSAQATLRVRATEAVPVTVPPSPAGATSAAIPAAVTTGVEPSLQLRSGRVRLPSRFGPALTTLQIPASLEYWTGQTWVLSAEDSTTRVPSGAVSVGTDTMVGTVASIAGQFANGVAMITLKPAATSGRGSVPFALNLGASGANTSCYAAKMTTATGAGLAFLRAVDPSCAALGPVDPSAMATFGVYPPETKRIIHMREVFR